MEEEEKEEEDFLKYFASKAPSQLLPKDAIFEEPSPKMASLNNIHLKWSPLNNSHLKLLSPT